MEKQHKNKNFFLKLLPKAASAVNFRQNPPFSPGRDHHHSSTKLIAHAYKGFSGPINFAALPDETREKPKSESYDSQEPTSPKVSCMGQIKYKHKIKNKLLNASTKTKSSPSVHHQHKQSDGKSKEVDKSRSSISKIFSRSTKAADSRSKVAKVTTRDNHAENSKNKMLPSLGHMRKFASGRDSLANFDWTAQIAPIDHDRDCYSDDEKRRESENEEEEEETEIIIPFSAPILGGGRGRIELEPRKEVNLWKRRTMDPPPPLSFIPKVR